jgi:DnaJ like chaperone protein
MGLWGKFIGGIAGFAVGGPLGALLGVAAGHAVDKMRGGSAGLIEADRRVDLRTAGHRDRAAREMAFGVAVVVLGAKMAKADGTVNRREVDAFKEVFHVPPQEVKNVARIFDVAKRDAKGFEPYAKQVALLFRDELVVLEQLLAGLFHIARADGEVSPAELGFLRRCAVIFGLDEAAFSRVQRQFAVDAEPDPYRVLGIDPAATDEEVKKTYRRLIREHHPDTLVAKGMPREFVDMANARMAAINAAYDVIEKRRAGSAPGR